MWILVVDSSHIVTFSANQSWKSRWPPLQVASRIANVSFRGFRNSSTLSAKDQKYSALMHAIVCIHGAVGLLHRNFWSDLVLPCTDRYAGYLSHLQYRLYRAPSTKLLMELLQVQDELNIILEMNRKQERILNILRDHVHAVMSAANPKSSSDLPVNSTQFTSAANPFDAMNQRPFLSPKPDTLMPNAAMPNLDQRQSSFTSSIPSATPSSPLFTPLQVSSNLDSPDAPALGVNDKIPMLFRRRHLLAPSINPVNDVLDRLIRETEDLSELRNNANELVNRTVQLVNIRLEDHGLAIMVFTLVTVLFLPLSFLSSFFGMNGFNVKNTQVTFWTVAAVLTAAVVGASSLLAFYGGRLIEYFIVWKDSMRSDNPPSYFRTRKFATRKA